jgi:hypothetical protein
MFELLSVKINGATSRIVRAGYPSPESRGVRFAAWESALNAAPW